MVRAALLLTLLAQGEELPPGERPGDPVWRTEEVVEKGGDKTFAAAGTKKGNRYVFRARGECRRKSRQVWVAGRPVIVDPFRHQKIFGIEFRVTFGAQEHKHLDVGEGKPLKTELSFVADRDGVPIRIEDHWELPKDVECVVDNIEVVVPPEVKE